MGVEAPPLLDHDKSGPALAAVARVIHWSLPPSGRANRHRANWQLSRQAWQTTGITSRATVRPMSSVPRAKCAEGEIAYEEVEPAGRGGWRLVRGPAPACRAIAWHGLQRIPFSGSPSFNGTARRISPTAVPGEATTGGRRPRAVGAVGDCHELGIGLGEQDVSVDAHHRQSARGGPRRRKFRLIEFDDSRAHLRGVPQPSLYGRHARPPGNASGPAGAATTARDRVLRAHAIGHGKIVELTGCSG